MRAVVNRRGTRSGIIEAQPACSFGGFSQSNLALGEILFVPTNAHNNKPSSRADSQRLIHMALKHCFGGGTLLRPRAHLWSPTAARSLEWLGLPERGHRDGAQELREPSLSCSWRSSTREDRGLLDLRAGSRGPRKNWAGVSKKQKRRGR